MTKWKDIKDFEGVYQVSDCGQVRRLAGTRHAGGGRLAAVPERVLAGTIARVGYRVVSLGRANPKYIHRLVCEAFHGPPPKGKNQVAHYDGDKLNNNASNLRWADWADNRKDGARLGEIKRGTQITRAVLTESEVLDIRQRRACGEGMRSIGRSYGICHQHVGDIIRRRIWKHID